MIKRILPSILLGLGFVLLSANVAAQINYKFTASSSTYTPLTTGSNISPTALSTGTGVASPATDDGYKNAIPIGFTFNYNGTNYTKVNVCTNGFVSLSSALFTTTTSTTSPVYLSSHDLVGSNPADSGFRPIIAPFWADLDVQTSGTGGGISYKTLGSTPNRTFTLQWKNVKWDYSATVGCLSFQMILHETTNVIDFVYNREVGTPVTDPANTNPPVTASIGITAKVKGITSFISLQDTTASPTISRVNEGALSGRPSTGQMYTFTPLPVGTLDASLSNIYSLGTVATSADPQPIGAYIANYGNTTLTNLPVYLNVTGANNFKDTFVIVSLASGASGSLTFKNFQPNNTGVNNITVSVPTDGDTTNNKIVTTQTVSSGTIDYTTTAPTFAGVGLTGAGTTWEIASKITNPGTHNVNNILLNFNTGGQPFTATIYDASGTSGSPGTALWQSASILTSVAGAMSIPVSPSFAVTGDYFVAINQTDTISFDYAYEYEYPVRSGKFYFQSNTSGAFYDVRNTGAAFFKLKMGVQHDIVTPVKLTSFNGIKLDNKSNKITWSTATEINNAGFELQRSKDGIKFEKLIFVNSKATSSQAIINYNYIDENPYSTVTYYRLKQIDKDGKFELSSVVAVKSTTIIKVEIIKVYPNPVQEKLNIVFNTSSAEKVTISITDLVGKIISTQVVETIIGENTTSFNTAKLASGTYVLKIFTTKGEEVTQKIIKQ